MTSALIVVDVQRGFDEPVWGPRNNPRCEENVGRLLAAWRRRGDPVVYVRHDSEHPDSPLRAGQAGNDFKDVLDGDPDLLVTKKVNSAFIAEPDLHAWLGGHGVKSLVICGIQTNHCCESTARMAGNLGYDVLFPLDATHAFDLTGPDGTVFPAEQVARMTAANLHGEFAIVTEARRLT